MPTSAIATGLVDFVAKPDAIAKILVAYVGGPYLSSAPRLASTAEAEAPVLDEPPLKQILAQLRARCGNDFSDYKTSTIRRRIERRMNVHGIHKAAEFVQFTKDHPEELDALFKELLISVTNFFRDPDAFESLGGEPLRTLLAAHDADSVLRAWVPGCATGEEVYSLAILLRECMDDLGKHPKVMIFGTDLDEQAVSFARSGLYSPGIIGDLEPARLERYFTKEDGGFRVRKEVRDMVIFAPQNVISDPPFTKLDLLSCRNLLIYMTPALQKRLLPVFAYALNPGGLMLLGPHESLAGAADRFDTIDKKWKIFRRNSHGNLHSVLHLTPNTRKLGIPSMPENPPSSKRFDLDPVAATMGRLLLAKFAPPCVVVNRKGDIEFIHGRTGAYLEPAAGRPRLNIFDMAREGLQAALDSAVSDADSQDGEISRDNIRVRSNGDFVTVNFTVNKLHSPDAVDGLFMVTFSLAEPRVAEDAGSGDTAADPVDKKPSRIEALEREVQYTRESLQSAVEELETSNEELTSTNEELQSTNEELQSANEELETSREEMQSLNEELSTVNAELQAKVAELSHANDEMQNLLNGTEIATVYLNNELAIERYTNEATKLISLIPGDIGRFIGDLTMNLKCDSLVDDAREVLASLVFKESEVQTKDGAWYLMRVMPYRTAENLIQGLVMTFVNIDELRSAEATTALARDFFEGIVNTLREPLLVLSADLKVISANQSFYNKFHSRKQAVEGGVIFELGGGEWDIPELRKLLEEIVRENTVFEDYRVEHDFPRIGQRVFLLNARRIEAGDGDGHGDGSTELILLAIEDVTEVDGKL